MHRLIAAVVLVLWALPGYAAGTPADHTIVLRHQITVDGPTVHLGDLFDGLGRLAATPVARAPEPGRRLQVDARWLAAVAKAYALPWRPSSHLERTVVERASLVVGPGAIEDELRAALAGRGVGANASLRIDNPAQRLHLPTNAAPTVAVSALSHDAKTGRFVAHLVAPAEGTPLVRATVTGRAMAMVELPVLRRRLTAGDVIARNDIDWIRVRADRIGRATVSESDKLVGMSPRRPIRPGEPVQSGDLQAPVVVAKSSLVTIRLQTDRMILTAQGRALENGAMGDVIRVANTQSSQVIHAAITGPGIVQVYPALAGRPIQEVRR